ncbi:MAG: oxygen-independent coproporphyrinogen III oxidase [Alphaproteobacteria bacterium]
MSDHRLAFAAPNLPRYTSYPTAPHFTGDVTDAVYGDWLGALTPEAPLSVYLHLPFCAQMCWYCGCHTKITRRIEPVERYGEALVREVDLVADRLTQAMPISHLHWGGGTPTMLPLDHFARVMERIRTRFAVRDDAELAVEADPRTVTPELARGLAAQGINRMSFGIQDFDPRVQAAINRVQCAGLVSRAVGLLQDVGIKHISFDLIYGLPHQTLDSLRRTVDQAVAMGPDRLSVFGYAHVPWMKTHQKMIDTDRLADAEGRLEQVETIAAALEAHGYVRVGLDHFAKAGDSMAAALAQGDLQRNFQGYTTDQAQGLIGFGASAIGTLPQGYSQNAPDLGGYERAISEGRLATVRGRALTPDDRTRRAVIERLMCDMAVDLDTIDGAAGLAPVLRSFDPMVRAGLAEVTGHRVRLNERARPVMRWAAARFDAYLEPQTARHSVGV